MPTEATVPTARGEAGPLHLTVPLTPTGILLRRRGVVPLIVASFALLALAAALAHGALLLEVDEPIQRAVEGARTPDLTRFFRTVSRLGGTATVAVGLVVLLTLAWRRCRSLALVLLAATLARPVLEWVLKAGIDRSRPDLDQLVSGHGPSFPSGHVMAAMALWGLLPSVVALLTHRRRLWWASVAASGVIIGLVAASRVYLGVHWLSDVVGGLLLGALYLLGVERLLELGHRRRPCAALGPDG